jgi:hypothetical protein
MLNFPKWINKTLRVLIPAGALIFGVLTTRVAVLSDPCPGHAPSATVIAPTVTSPVLYGMVSGFLWGLWPKAGYGQVESCVVSDMGVGIPLSAFEQIRKPAAYAWAGGRGIGFALSSWLVLWVLSWLFRAARVLSIEDKTGRQTS